MTPERAAELVARWVRFYTRELPTPIAQRRVDEIGADLHDHFAQERARGTSDRHIALSILSRMARGLIADVSWRRRIRPLKGDLMVPFVAILAPALGVAAIMYGEADDAPGLVLFGILLIGGALAFGLRPALRSRSRVLGFILAAIAVTAIGSGVAGWLENAV
ncbi:MAG: hypothetical protein M3454_02495 [Actinomycetota bacterium]|nr:hypothetical protein [Actinomycetota bacterium]